MASPSSLKISITLWTQGNFQWLPLKGSTLIAENHRINTLSTAGMVSKYILVIMCPRILFLNLLLLATQFIHPKSEQELKLITPSGSWDKQNNILSHSITCKNTSRQHPKNRSLPKFAHQLKHMEFTSMKNCLMMSKLHFLNDLYCIHEVCSAYKMRLANPAACILGGKKWGSREVLCSATSLSLPTCNPHTFSTTNSGSIWEGTSQLALALGEKAHSTVRQKNEVQQQQGGKPTGHEEPQMGKNNARDTARPCRWKKNLLGTAENWSLSCSKLYNS